MFKMNSLGLSILFTMGCSCGKECVNINGKKFTVRARLAEGGFSVVDLVQDEAHRTYALKRLACHSKEDERNCMMEVEYYRTFKHPNIIECVDATLVGRSDVDHYSTSEVLILLPYFKRGTLQDELQIRSRTKEYISEARVLRIFKQMCEGVQAMHNAKPYALAHRDLKPANVLLTVDDIPVWMDMGSMTKARVEIRNSSEARALQDAAAEKCTMLFRAPELFTVESHTSIDERIDTWALGCCLYAMCYFKSPFESAYQRGDSVALAVVSGNIDFPDISPYSQGIENLINTMLQINALQRPFIDTVILQVTKLLSEAEAHV